MAKPLAAMTLDELVKLGRYHVVALRHTEATKGLIADFAKALEALSAALETDRLAQLELLAASFPVNLATYEATMVLGRISSLARGPENKDTPLYQAVFPVGLEGPLLHEDQELLTDLFALRERLVHLPTAKELKDQFLSELQAALAKLGESLAAHAQAEIAATRAREQAEKPRGEFLAAYERNAVTIAQLFPGQHKQDVFFDERDVDFAMMTAEADRWPGTSKKGGGRLS